MSTSPITPGRSGAGRGSTTAGLLVPSEQFVRLSPLPAVLVDASDRCRVVNEQFIEIFGYDLREIPTVRDWFRLVVPDAEERRRVTEAWRETARLEEGCIHHQPVSMHCRDGGERRCVFRTAALGDGSRFVTCEDDVREIRNMRSDGVPVWVRMTMRVVHAPSGRPLHLLSMTEDVTDRKEAEERLRVYADELARSNEDLQQLPTSRPTTCRSPCALSSVSASSSNAGAEADSTRTRTSRSTSSSGADSGCRP